MEAFGWSRFFDELARVLQSSYSQIEVSNERYANYIIEKLENALGSVEAIHERLVISSEPENELEPYEQEIVIRYREMTSDLCSVIEYLLAYWDMHLSGLHTRSLAEGVSLVSSARNRLPGIQERGRPRFDIQRNQLEYLRSLNFSWIEISNLLGVSRVTTYRYRTEFGMLADDITNTVTNEELTTIIQQLRHDSPYDGETMIMGHLRGMGITVTRERVRSTIRRIDPLNTALRWSSNAIPRQPYSVSGPNSLWHLDGHHKLIRWRMVTHCGIDGYSRLVVFLKCSGNNRASTVYESFINAVQKYGVPSRVRTDQGRENILVAQFMLERNGRDRGSIITGSSVHNQRIERLWRDMHRCVIQLYYRLFYYFEQSGLLDPVNELHLFALHYVYVPRINKSLKAFMDGWNMHGLRTENNLSPMQLYTAGLLRQQQLDIQLLHNDFEQDLETDNTSDENTVVEVPEINLNLSEEDYHRLCTTINVLRHDDDNYGTDLYQETLEFLSSNCPSLRQ